MHANTFAQSDFVLGQDISYVNMMEDCGAQFREDGEVKDVYQIFADNGTNLIRVRLWHNPSWQEQLDQPDGVKAQYSNFSDVKETISRAKMAGMKVMLGFHFSDFWSDPGRQIVPKAWEAIANNETILKDSVYNYVFKVLTQLNGENLMPEYVKIGNENNSGIMTHSGMDTQYEGITSISTSWARHGRLYNAAIAAVRAVSENASIKPKISLHVADHNRAAWFYNNIIANGVTDFDVMGFTYYYSYHGGSPEAVGAVIKNLLASHQGYEAMIVETGYLWDTENIDGMGNIISGASPDYLPVSPANQKKFMLDLSNEVENTGGSGLIFWESAWVSTPCVTPWGTGSSQEHVAFFDHRDNLNYMKNGGGGWPTAFLNGDTRTDSQVSFAVDMTGEDVSRGVYLVGTLTDWKFVEMAEGGNSTYRTSLQLSIGDKHAYYYITTNNWTNLEDYRETVPEVCARSAEIMNDPNWTTDRAFIVPAQDTTLAIIWGACESLALSSAGPVTSDAIFHIVPNPVSQASFKIVMHDEYSEQQYALRIYDSLGREKSFHTESSRYNSRIEIAGFEKGLYYISLMLNKKNHIQKLLIF